MLDFMDRRQKRAKQPHVCRFCGREIMICQEYVRVCYSRKGRITTLSAHISCDALSIAYGQTMKKVDCNGKDVEEWIRSAVCARCADSEKCIKNPYMCTMVIDTIIVDACVRRAINEATR